MLCNSKLIWLCNILCLILDCGKCAFLKIVFKKESMNQKTMDEYNKTCEMLDMFHRTSFNPESSSLTLILPKTFTCTLFYMVGICVFTLILPTRV